MNDGDMIIGTALNCTITDKVVCKKCRDRFKCITNKKDNRHQYINIAIGGSLYKVLKQKGGSNDDSK